MIPDSRDFITGDPRGTVLDNFLWNVIEKDETIFNSMLYYQILTSGRLLSPKPLTTPVDNTIIDWYSVISQLLEKQPHSALSRQTHKAITAGKLRQVEFVLELEVRGHEPTPKDVEAASEEICAQLRGGQGNQHVRLDARGGFTLHIPAWKEEFLSLGMLEFHMIQWNKK